MANLFKEVQMRRNNFSVCGAEIYFHQNGVPLIQDASL